MTRKLICTSILAVAAVSVAAGTAWAQDREGNGRRRESGRAVQQGQAQRREAPPQAAPRLSGPRQQQAAAQTAPRGDERRPYAVPRTTSRGTEGQSYSAPRVEPRASRNAQPPLAREASRGGGAGQMAPRAAPRAYERPQSSAYQQRGGSGYSQYGGGYGRYETRGYVRPPHFQPYRPLYFSRPYYGFRPHVHIGFGVWLGVTVPYPWAYFGTYRPRVYGYYDQGYYGVAPGMYQYGGLSFDIQPSDADLYVDGEYVGEVGTFTPYGEPLTLWPGVHRIAIVREGFRTMEWEVTVQPGQVIPYRGMLARW
jgi:hypothetical protein